METQWPLVIFTLFVCITCGLLGSMSILALKGRGRDLQMTGLITSAVCLVIGGIGAFLHLEHWERIFNGFGHITSGITQELVGCVALAVVMVLWFVVLRKGEDKLPTWLPVVTLIVAVAMVIATGHSYLMPARAAWGVSLIVFYLCNACMLGPIVLWAIAQAKGDTEAEGAAINLAFIGAALQLVVDAIYAVSVAMSSMPDHGYYADPTAMTTPPKAVTDLFEVMVSGAAAPMFWSAIVCAVIVLVCALVARKKAGASKTYLVVAAVAALAASLFFRVAVYQLGFSVFMLY